MEIHDFKEYTQSIQNMISVAVGIAVLRSKPNNINGEQFAVQVQEKVLENWMHEKEPTHFEDKVLSLQRTNIFKQISDILQPPPLFNNASNSLNSLFPSVYGDVTWMEPATILSGETDTESDNSGSSNSNETGLNGVWGDAAFGIERNMDFIDAIVQLQSAVESNNTVSVNKLYSFIERQPVLANNQTNCTNKMVCYSEDSGFGDSSMPSGSEPTSLSSGILRYLTHSPKTDFLVTKCLSSVLSFASRSIQDKTEASFLLWKGSILEHLCSTLQPVSNHPSCRDTISNFITDILENVWQSTELNKHIAWEYEQTLLVQFCFNLYICECVINFLIEKLRILSSEIRSLVLNDSGHLNKTPLFEKAPHFISITISTVQKWLSFNTSQIKDQMDSVPDPYQVVKDLWKKNWCGVGGDKGGGEGEPREEGETGGNGTERVLKLWTEAAEELVTASTKHFPLVAFEAWHLLDILKHYPSTPPTSNTRSSSIPPLSII